MATDETSGAVFFERIDQDIHTEPMILQMGPSHPATHGTVRFTLTLDGETVIKCDTEVGYLHRGFEKECENSTWTQVFPYTDRLNYVSPLLNNFGYALAVEKLLGIGVPERCDWIRTLLGEISRISDHLTSVGAGALELGAMSAFLYAIEGRELTWDLKEEVTGARLTVSYGRIGGLKDDLTPDFAERWAYVRKRLLKIHGDTHKLLTPQPHLHGPHAGHRRDHAVRRDRLGLHRTVLTVDRARLRRAQGSPLLQVRGRGLRRDRGQPR